jgi:hypothetical protein
LPEVVLRIADSPVCALDLAAARADRAPSFARLRYPALRLSTRLCATFTTLRETFATALRDFHHPARDFRRGSARLLTNLREAFDTALRDFRRSDARLSPL